MEATSDFFLIFKNANRTWLPNNYQKFFFLNMIYKWKFLREAKQYFNMK